MSNEKQPNLENLPPIKDNNINMDKSKKGNKTNIDEKLIKKLGVISKAPTYNLDIYKDRKIKAPNGRVLMETDQEKRKKNREIVAE